MTKIRNPLNGRHHEHNNGQTLDLARRGSVAKTSNDGCAVHPGMTGQQKAAAGFGGMAHPTATIDGGEIVATSAAAAPLAHAYGGSPDLKTGKAVAPVPGQCSQTNKGGESFADKVQHGRDMLASAVKN